MNFSWDVGVWKNSYFSQSIDWLWEGEDLQQQAPLETLGTSLPCLWMQLLWIGLCIFSVKEICPFFFSWSLYRLALPGVCLTCYNLYIAIKSWNACDVSQWPLQGIQIGIPISALKQGRQLTSGHSPKSYKIVSIVHFSFSLLKKRWELGIFSWSAHMVVERGGSYGR